MEIGYHIIVVTKDDDLARQIESAVAGTVSSVRTVSETDIIQEPLSAKSIVFIDAHDRDGGITGLIARLKRTGNGCNLVVIGKSKTAESVLASMRAGAADFLPFPINTNEVAEAVRRIIERDDTNGAQGRIVAVFSLKGGLGVTSLTTNLVDHIHLLTGDSCLLADLNLYMGHACVFLDLQCPYTPFDLVSDLDRADDNLLFSSLVQSERGFHVLGISDLVAEASEITGDEINAMLRLLRRHIRYTVIDLPHDLSERTLAGLDSADKILLVVQQDVPSLKSAQLALRVFSDLDYDQSKISIVVNRYLKRNELELTDVENALKRPVLATIGNDYHAIASVYNKGQTIDAAMQQRRLNNDIARLAGLVTGIPPRIAKRRPWEDLLPLLDKIRNRS